MQRLTKQIAIYYHSKAVTKIQATNNWERIRYQSKTWAVKWAESYPATRIKVGSPTEIYTNLLQNTSHKIMSSITCQQIQLLPKMNYRTPRTSWLRKMAGRNSSAFPACTCKPILSKVPLTILLITTTHQEKKTCIFTSSKQSIWKRNWRNKWLNRLNRYVHNNIRYSSWPCESKSRIQWLIRYPNQSKML